MPRKNLILSLLALFPALASAQSTYFVNVDADSGPGTLRQAILDLNGANPPPADTRHTIRFEIPSVHITADLPVIQNPVQLVPDVRPNMTSTTLIGAGGLRLLTVDPSVTDGLAAASIRFEGGEATGEGGAIQAGYVSLRQCHFQDNRALRGGAISARRLYIDSCSFIGNSATESGGAVYIPNTGALAVGAVRIVNSTFDRNQSAAGGAVFAASTGGEMMCGHLTLTRNSAASGSALMAPQVLLRLGNSILADNTGAATAVEAGTLSPAGVNWMAGDPQLAEPSPLLTFPAYSRHPLPRSPVIDAGIALPVAQFPFTGNDTRNINRPVGAGPDLGALESRIFTVTALLSDEAGGWRDAVEAFNASQADLIFLPAGHYSLQSQPPVLQRSGILWGESGSRIDGMNLYQPVRTGSGLHLHGIEFRRGRNPDPITSSGGAVHIEHNNLRASVVEHCQFIDNHNSSSGGAVSIGGGQVLVRRCAFLGNRSINGQGGALVAFFGQVQLENCTFYANQASFQASAIENREAEMTLLHCTVDSNTSTQNTGAGVQSQEAAGRLRVYNSVISRNTNSTGSSNLNAAGAGELDVRSSYIGDAPGLGNLVLPGGTTPAYLPPVSATPLVDAADPLLTSPEDQRGLARPEHGLPDIGAIERYTDPYRAWIARARDATTLGDLAARDTDWGAAADGDGDGSPNAVELLLDGDPWDADVAPRLELLRQPAGLRFSVFLRDGLPDLDWALDLHSALDPSGPWTIIPPGDSFLDTPAGGFTPVRYPVPAAQTRRVFRVALPDVRLVDPLLTAVGEPGNAVDPGTGRGAVANVYLIARHEVTAWEYTAFLNAVDPLAANSRDLWRSSMETHPQGSILRVATAPAGQRYRVKTGRARFPANFLTYYNALRYCNWLHHGAAVGADTESGAYLLLGGTPTPSNASSILRENEARYFLPTSDEWYKAAYFVNDLSLGGLGAYADYPNRANTINNLPAPGDGRSANYRGGAFLGALSAAGNYRATRSAWGCFDQAGNVREMMQVPFANSILVLVAGGGFGDADGSRALRSQFGLDAVERLQPLADLGFRVAAARP
jgi:predicted outer membrane repeat protein